MLLITIRSRGRTSTITFPNTKLKVFLGFKLCQIGGVVGEGASTDDDHGSLEFGGLGY